VKPVFIRAGLKGHEDTAGGWGKSPGKDKQKGRAFKSLVTHRRSNFGAHRGWPWAG
jgi:hypothetical protein